MEAAAYETFARNERDHFWFIGRRAIVRDLVRRFAAPSLGPDARLLDLGCGVGGMHALLSEFGAVSGMDLDDGSLRYCRERGFTGVFKALGDALPLADASFDVVGAFDVIEHIPEEEETAAECLRVLKPGGWMFVTCPAYQFLWTHQDEVVHHQRRYTRGRLRGVFERAGFEVKQVSHINFFLFPLILPTVLARKVAERISPPRPEDTRFNTDVKIPGPLNALFARIYSSERVVLRGASMPVGHSLALAARKPLA